MANLPPFLAEDEPQDESDYQKLPAKTPATQANPDVGLDQDEDQDQHEYLTQDELLQPAPDSFYALGGLELELTLRCGRLSLTLDELRRLDSGTVVEVDSATPGHAGLYHGEQLIAEGELVEVDGRLGLQLTRLARSE